MIAVLHDKSRHAASALMDNDLNTILRPVANFDFAQVIFRLPNNPAAGKATIKVSAHGQTSNSGVITISN